LKLAYLQNCTADSNKILHNAKRPPKTLHGWSNRAYNKSKTADGRYLKKNKNCHFSATIQAIAMKFGTTTLRPTLIGLFENFTFFKQSKVANGNYFKI